MTEKSEIEAMPEGMSSEEIDALTTGEEVEAPEVIAQEVTTEEKPSPAEESVEDKTEVEETAVEEKPEEKEEVEEKVDPKDAVIGDFRRKLRDEELRSARLEGELETRKSIQTTTGEEVKSPLEVAEATYIKEFGSLEGFSMDGELYRKQRAFDDKVVADRTLKTDEEQALTKMNREITSLQAGDLSPAKVGDGVDFKSVIALGKGYLDKADVMKIEITSHRDGIPAGVRKTYELCKQAILNANNEDTKLLHNAMKVKSQTKPKKKPTDIDALTTEGDDEDTGETETDNPNQRLANFICE